MKTHTEAYSSDGSHSEPSEDSVRREAERALRGSSHCGLRGIECQAKQGHVILKGEVASYYLKQIAQTIVGRVPHVLSVDNQVKVVGHDADRFGS